MCPITCGVAQVRPRRHSVPHRTLLKDAANLTLDDVDGAPLDAILRATPMVHFHAVHLPLGALVC